MSLPRLLFLLLLLLPVLEIYLMIQVGGVIGAIPTIALVVFTAVLGALLLRHQGLAVLQRVQQLAQQGEAPTAAMLEGVVILLSGAMLLLPGFFTDALGLLGLVPPLRHALVAVILR
ncbi:MAG: FxsA family protein, partial [Pseudomonadota bacterium]